MSKTLVKFRHLVTSYEEKHDSFALPVNTKVLVPLNIRMQEKAAFICKERAGRLAFISWAIGREIDSTKDLTRAEAESLLRFDDIDFLAGDYLCQQLTQ